MSMNNIIEIHTRHVLKNLRLFQEHVNRRRVANGEKPLPMREYSVRYHPAKGYRVERVP